MDDDLTIDDISTLIKTARASVRPGTIHSCQLCSIRELELVETDDMRMFCAAKYRGTTVLEGVLKGCDFFLELITGLEYELHVRGYGDGSGCVLEFRPRKWICQLSFMGVFHWATIKWTSVDGELPTMPLAGAAGPRSRFYSLVTNEDNAASGSVRVRPFSFECTLSQVATWTKDLLQECETHQESCSKPDASFVPSRLLQLDVGNEDGILVKLIVDAATRWRGTGNDLDYAVLSYCWGGTQDLQLNARTEEQLRGGFHVCSLPKTLGDAVRVAWDLELRFIWIDCLCIRQDDPYDLDHEIAQVPAIYGNAHITISAARSADSREGFLHPSSLPPLTSAAFKLPFACPDGDLGSVILCQTRLNAPIDDRSWTLQEYILSRRVLQFTDFRPNWACRRTIKLFDDEPDSLPALYITNIKKLYRMYLGFYDNSYTCRHWMNIVQEYTTRDLTYPVDTLKAISGIAENWSSRSGDSYTAGIWRSHLPLGLLWTSAQPFLQSASAAYRAPSWSWASLDGQVDWFDHLLTNVDYGLAIKSCSAMPTYEQAPYGAVVSGSLVICGRLQETLFPYLRSNPSNSPGSLSSGDFLDLDLAIVFPDFGETMNFQIVNAKIYCLQVCTFDDERGVGPSGLILADDGANFRRIGAFFFEPPQKDDVRRLGDYAAISSLSEDIRNIQRAAFADIEPRVITIL